MIGNISTRGIWLPIEVVNDKNTTFQEKLILMEINQLSMLDEGCIASNSHFATLFKIKKEAVSRSINSLQEKGYISIEIIDGSRNHKRIVNINKLLFGYEQNVNGVLTNCLETKDNKTINKTINKTKEIILPDWLDKEVWNKWVSFRKEIKKKLTPTTIKEQLEFLEKHKSEHTQIINKSIQSGWVGLFELKKQNTYNEDKRRRETREKELDYTVEDEDTF